MQKILNHIVLALGIGCVMSSVVACSAEVNATHTKRYDLVRRILQCNGNVESYNDSKKMGNRFKDLKIDDLSENDIEYASNITCWNISLTPEDIKTLASLKKLRMLGFEKMDVPSALVEAIAAQQWNLEILGFRYGSLPDDFGKLVKNLKGVESLSFVGMKMTDKTLKDCSGLNIERLAIFETPITDNGLKSMLPFGKLETLTLDDTKISDGITEVLDSCPKLKALWIWNSDIKCSFLQDMKHTDSIRFIAISKTNLEDEVFRSITRFKNLDELRVYSKHLTKKSISAAEDVAKKAWSVTVSNDDGKLFNRLTDENYKYDR